MKAEKFIYWGSTALFTAVMTMSAGMYLFNNAEVAKTFGLLGFPVFVIYPLALAKLLGIVAVLTRKLESLTEWAYAGFVFNTLLAFGAHWFAGDGEYAPALVVFVLVLVSYFTGKEVRNN
jgi:hypothetical protein